MEFTIYHNPYHNCRNMTVSAMVKRLGISLDYIWGQAGLSFKEEHQDITITPYYRSMESDFSQSHGIVTHEDNIADSYEFLHHLIGLVQANHTVAVMVDVFEMPYCIYYQLHHEIHDVEIVGMDGKHFVICDHYYHYYGTIEIEQIRKAASASIDQLGFESCTAYYFTISRTSHFTYSEMDFTRVAAENYHVMSGKPIGFLKEQTRGLHIGLFALAPMKQRITEFLYVNDQTDPGYLYNLYKMVKEVCNSRHHFHVFLQAFDQKELAFDYRVAAQHWGVIANLMVRAYLSKNYIGMAPRVELRFRKATEKETENTEKLQAMLM
ncbi:BtrH N-terminal domain-containing protein [Brevibacillus migulae]|uniref:BtrH N-terminal domain-containing protein n=1 Tax=Brevibacillus migulae TaxID=1644114 RepID=UPI00106E0F0F|nr:BtrH N-terminal domain-containing protein [Brevibacillus migulae]